MYKERFTNWEEDFDLMDEDSEPLAADEVFARNSRGRISQNDHFGITLVEDLDFFDDAGAKKRVELLQWVCGLKKSLNGEKGKHEKLEAFLDELLFFAIFDRMEQFSDNEFDEEDFLNEKNFGFPGTMDFFPSEVARSVRQLIEEVIDDMAIDNHIELINLVNYKLREVLDYEQNVFRKKRLDEYERKQAAKQAKAYEEKPIVARGGQGALFKRKKHRDRSSRKKNRR